MLKVPHQNLTFASDKQAFDLNAWPMPRENMNWPLPVGTIHTYAPAARESSSKASWTLSADIKAREFLSDPDDSRSRKIYSLRNFNVTAIRSPHHYYWTTIIPYMLITLVVLTVGTIKTEATGERLHAIVELLLAAMSVRWVLSSYLPTSAGATSMIERCKWRAVRSTGGQCEPRAATAVAACCCLALHPPVASDRVSPPSPPTPTPPNPSPSLTLSILLADALFCLSFIAAAAVGVAVIGYFVLHDIDEAQRGTEVAVLLLDAVQHGNVAVLRLEPSEFTKQSDRRLWWVLIALWIAKNLYFFTLVVSMKKTNVETLKKPIDFLMDASRDPPTFWANELTAAHGTIKEMNASEATGAVLRDFKSSLKKGIWGGGAQTTRQDSAASFGSLASRSGTLSAVSDTELQDNAAPSGSSASRSGTLSAFYEAV